MTDRVIARIWPNDTLAAPLQLFSVKGLEILFGLFQALYSARSASITLTAKPW